MKKLLLILLLPSFTIAQNNYASRLDSFMQTEVKARQFNGNVLVAKSGKVIYQKAFGYSNYTTKQILNNNSVFELASISKQFTAMGILLLVEKGKLKLSDTLRMFFPELPYQNITLQHLLTHYSGLPDYEKIAGVWDSNKIAFNKDVINYFTTYKPAVLFQPGEKWYYSNTGYVLLASIIEKVSHQSFKEYLDKNIFKPLKMQRSRVYNTRRSGEKIDNYAYGYVYSDSLKKYILPDSLPQLKSVFYLDGIQGGAIVNSTTGDLLKWDRALKNNSLLSEKMQKQMLSPQSSIDTSWMFVSLLGLKDYGYGIGIGKDNFGNFQWHGGALPGYRTTMSRYVDNDVTIVVLSNNESKVLEISSGLAAIVMHK